MWTQLYRASTTLVVYDNNDERLKYDIIHKFINSFTFRVSETHLIQNNHKYNPFFNKYIKKFHKDKNIIIHTANDNIDSIDSIIFTLLEKQEEKIINNNKNNINIIIDNCDINYRMDTNVKLLLYNRRNYYCNLLIFMNLDTYIKNIPPPDIRDLFDYTILFTLRSNNNNILYIDYASMYLTYEIFNELLINKKSLLIEYNKRNNQVSEFNHYILPNKCLI